MELFLFWIGIAIVTGIAASNKGRSAFGWFILGALFSLLALLLVLVLPSLKQIASANYADALSPDTHVRCPDCREIIFKDARKCKHCGTALLPQ